jgi:uncharacterized protein YyaL (SSP411 family)
VWTRSEIREFATEGEFKLAEEIWGVTESGNFMDPHHPVKGWNVLALQRVPAANEDDILEGLRDKMRRSRNGRIRPGKDDKVLTSWNALAISGYAKAARWGGGSHYAKRAEEIWFFLEENLLRKDGTPTHRWRNGKKDDVHLLEDYAGVLQALVDLHQVTLKVEYLKRAVDLAKQMLETFEDRERGGLWASVDESLIARMKDDYDGAEPSGNAVAAQPNAELAARRILDWLGERMRRLPQAVPHGLMALERIGERSTRLILAGAGCEKFLEVVGNVYRPDVLISGASEDHPSEFVQKLGKETRRGTAYLCEGGVCQMPVEKAEELERALRMI